MRLRRGAHGTPAAIAGGPWDPSGFAGGPGGPSGFAGGPWGPSGFAGAPGAPAASPGPLGPHGAPRDHHIEILNDSFTNPRKTIYGGNWRVRAASAENPFSDLGAILSHMGVVLILSLLATFW